MSETYLVKWYEIKNTFYEKEVTFEDDALFHMSDKQVEELAFENAVITAEFSDISKNLTSSPPERHKTEIIRLRPDTRELKVT